MKRILYIFFLLLFSICLSGCFLLIPTSTTAANNTPVATLTKNNQTISQLLVRRWYFIQEYDMRKTQRESLVTNTTGIHWVQFYSNGTCRASGFWGVNGTQLLRWEVFDHRLRIYGNNLRYGEMSGSQVEYDICMISPSQLILKRWNGRTQDGWDIIHFTKLASSKNVSPASFLAPEVWQPRYSKPVSQLLARRWSLVEAYNVRNSQKQDVFTNASKTHWIQFYPNGTCYEYGFLGTNGRQLLRWEVFDHRLRIYGNNLTYGELSGSQVEYDICMISSSQLIFKRWNGRTPDGRDIIRYLKFTK